MNNKSPNKNCIIGVAGYMGSGKTTFSTSLADNTGYLLVNGDQKAKELMLAHTGIRQKIIAAFGREMVQNDAIIFSKLGTIVFGSLEKLKQLNAIVHPVLLESLQKMIFTSAGTNIIVDAALIPLWGIECWFDTLIWIEAGSGVRCERLCRKGTIGGIDRVVERMNMQERLFSRPSKDDWKYIDNQGEISDLKKIAIRYADSVTV